MFSCVSLLTYCKTSARKNFPDDEDGGGGAGSGHPIPKIPHKSKFSVASVLLGVKLMVATEKISTAKRIMAAALE
jgi:hypothetical protein